MPVAKQALQRVRNIGLVAHIDAGKTTVTERILLFSGRIHRSGEVHDGQATMDYMAEEQERGITITSAATNCEWRNHQFNIIDTPGHVDFTAEVERSLRVLDGAIGVFCAVAGVEAQSETVWRQASKYKVPRLAFINKMDRVGADFQKAVKSIRDRLGVHPVPIQIPFGQEKDFGGLIDLISMKLVTFPTEDGNTIEVTEIPESHKAAALEARDKMLEAISEFDEAILEKYLDGEEIAFEDVIAAIRRGTISNEITPVLCGTALKNKGVQALLDAVVRFLPSPLDVPPITGSCPQSSENVIRHANDEEPLAALAFKIVSDPNGDLTFVRVYSGVLRQGDKVLNVNNNGKERIGRIVRMHAASRQQIEELRAGDIAAVIGLKNTVTGETLADMENPVVLENIEFPETVISLAIEPKSKADRDKLGTVLAKLAKEDPTFTRYTDDQTGQTIISGMGELHLEVLCNRITREFGVAAEMGRPTVAYRQTIRKPVDIEGRHVKQSGGKGQYGVVKVRFEPSDGLGLLEFKDEIVGGAVPREYIPAVEAGIREATQRVQEWRFPFVGIQAALYDGSSHDVDSSEMAFKAAGILAFRNAVAASGTILLEPLMKIEVQVPEEFVGDAVGDLTSRRAGIEDIGGEGNIRRITGKVPIAEMFGYSTSLRSMTQGRGTYSMEPCEYAPVPENIAEQVRREYAERDKNKS
ncbi:MAG: elongation factor G [Planctomycetota bacterium]